MTQGEQLIQEEEGPSSPTVYLVAGIEHIARGRVVDAKVPGAGLCQAALDAQDANDLATALFLAQAIPGYSACNAVQQAVLQSMCFQLGDLSGWPHFRAALVVADYAGAADQMLYKDGTVASGPSEWYTQTPARCAREAYMMRKGEWLDYGVSPPAS